MKTLYIYPIVFGWDQIVPVEYPFIKVKGPEGCAGVLMVFDDRRDYDIFAATNSKVVYEPLLIQQPERKDDGEQNGRDRTGEGEGEVFGGRRGSEAGKGRSKANGVAKRGRKH